MVSFYSHGYSEREGSGGCTILWRKVNQWLVDTGPISVVNPERICPKGHDTEDSAVRPTPSPVSGKTTVTSEGEVL